QRALERDGGIDRDLEVVGCDIGAGSFETHGSAPRGEGAIPEKEGTLQPNGGGFTPPSHEREPNCRDRRWQNAVYTGSDPPACANPGRTACGARPTRTPPADGFGPGWWSPSASWRAPPGREASRRRPRPSPAAVSGA